MRTPTTRPLRSSGFYRAAKWASLVAVPLVIAVFGTIGYNAAPAWYAGMAGAVLPFASYVAARRGEREAALRRRARARWGASGLAAERQAGRDDPGLRARYLAWTRDDGAGPVDDRTWADLGMEAVAAEMDVCFTDAGRNELHRLLRHCLVSPEEVEGRALLAAALLGDERLRQELLRELAAVGQERDADPAGLLWGKQLEKERGSALFIGMSVAAVVALAAAAVTRHAAAAVAVAGVFIVNMWLYYSKARNLTSLIPSLRVLSRMLQAAERLASRPTPVPGLEAGELSRRASAVARLRRPLRWLLTGAPGTSASLSADIFEVIFLYVKIFFVVDLVAFDRIAAVVSADLEGMRALYRAVGRLDALIAVASYRVFRPHQCAPVFEAGSGIAADGVYHPLVRQAVRNSVEIARPGVLVTGTNMAGKSTMLRTLGINAILAQTTGACCARSYRADRFIVMSSIEKRDDLGAGKSFYYDEAERIFKMIERVGGGAPVLLLIDELLAGTNSLERESASVAILHYLARRSALTVAATHDIAIAKRLEGLYQPFYFTDRADEKGLSFDYKLRPGIVQSRNAIKLLSLIGYPQDVIQEALRSCEEG